MVTVALFDWRRNPEKSWRLRRFSTAGCQLAKAITIAARECMDIRGRWSGGDRIFQAAQS